MAAFYTARGDAMLANKDISAARKFYEYAANAGSARAAAALGRTYDPAFAAQLDEVGLRPNPELAAVWYRKAAELAGKQPQLSQSGDTGK
jgi:TPR repeat protein